MESVASEQNEASGEALAPSLVASQAPACIRIVSKVDMHDGQVWVGLFMPGELDPQNILNESNGEKIFQDVADKGIADESAVMLTDNCGKITRFFYLLPVPTAGNSNEWVDSAIATLASLNPESIGIYFSPKLVDVASSSIMLDKVVDGVLSGCMCREFILFQGDHGYDSLLSSAHGLRRRLSGQVCAISVVH